MQSLEVVLSTFPIEHVDPCDNLVFLLILQFGLGAWSWLMLWEPWARQQPEKLQHPACGDRSGARLRGEEAP